ncbi:hypothetical protein [Curtobacterium sp. B18]|nr:hypothetical protein [Curtobacterium sp. B18]
MTARNRSVQASAGALGTELQVDIAVVEEHGVSRSSDQKWMPARPFAFA